ncbi:DNA internalization-related competence protein ComEC/Rec2 [Methylophaga sulfidovorans]|uniref:Competence protein ComEC n=1 Tax=Methylophaga sulfidovorans TaxID=45496 RepID=A0A1I3XHI9_9GAMM|nr:DNA internalization-related competence protein ComEC/Rec2 [Methylophaga sulfidovorans]SFK18809.1 competence protein ComEC [Methylophaga sulfidovorans]
MNKTAIAFLLGTLFSLYVSYPLVTGSLLLLCLVTFIYYRKIWILGFIVGLLWCAFQAQFAIENKLATDAPAKVSHIQGLIASIPETFPDHISFEFLPDAPDLPSKIKLSWYFPPEHYPKAGERWQLTVKLKPPFGMMNPGGFDYEKWLFSQDIGATGYIKKAADNQRLAKSTYWQINDWRFQLQQQIQSLIPAASQLPLILGLAIGQRDDISPSQWQILRQTGTSHLMAISGLHIGLAAGLGFYLISWLWRYSPFNTFHIPAHRIGAVAGLVVAIFYACLAGLSIPTQRALIMVSLAMLALFLKRQVYPSHILSLACIMVLLLNPFALLSAGFWLSFAAVAIILMCFTQRFPAIRLAWLKIHFVMALGLIPLLVFFFTDVSVISPIANLIAIPLVSILVVPLIILAMIVLPISSSLAAILLYAADFLLDILWHILSFLSDVPFASWNTPIYPWPLLFMLILAILLILLPRGYPGKYLALVFLMPLLFYKTERPDSGDFYLSVLDVGQGLASVIETKHHTLIFDTGPQFSDSFNTGEAVVIPFLRYRAINQIDTLLISHGDNDHIGGLHGVINNTEVNQIMSSQTIRDVDTLLCSAGQHWQWDGVEFAVLQPFPEQSGSENERSCVLRIQGKNQSALLPGDIEKQSEQKLVQQYGDELKSDILLVPHHGSRTSSSMPFVHAVSPRYAIFSVGFRNRYGFPVKDIVQRYKVVGSEILRTDWNGAILFRNGDAPVLWRQHEEHLWTSKATE